ncbi:YggT family protein [Intestinirhabdus alba]|jgi:YggT family protein|uniref:YggT family protein n=1 Tax=Intestinirhabdus alba TaxID=2899544 RepID=A0A6L6INP4_9ENTR|nr:YggT family protein [Intestinirhabdus alba]MTH48139.1 YggT family protein [Intestinirhabdus alba]
MNTLSTLLSLVIQIYTMILLLRIWMQWARCDFYNPFAQFIVKATQPVVGPLRRLIPALGPVDTASLLIALLLSVGKVFLNPYVSVSGIYIIFSAALILIKTTGSLLFWVVLMLSIMSWVSRGRSPVEYVLIQLTEPLLRPIRNLLPAMGGIDFSPMILVLLMYVINMGVTELLSNIAIPLAYIWSWA